MLILLSRDRLESSRKRQRNEPNSGHCQSRRTGGNPQSGKVLTISSFQGASGLVPPPIVQPEKVTCLEIQPHERWTAGEYQPMQIIQAFNLPHDYSSYVDRSRNDFADRCLNRFLSDFVHVVEFYHADAGSRTRDLLEEEVSKLKGKLSELDKVAIETFEKILEKARVLLELEAENARLKEEIKKLTETKGTVKIEVNSEKEKVGKLEKELDGLIKEVVKLWSELDKSVNDLAEALGSSMTSATTTWSLLASIFSGIVLIIFF